MGKDPVQRSASAGGAGAGDLSGVAGRRRRTLRAAAPPDLAPHYVERLLLFPGTNWPVTPGQSDPLLPPAAVPGWSPGVSWGGLGWRGHGQVPGRLACPSGFRVGATQIAGGPGRDRSSSWPASRFRWSRLRSGGGVARRWRARGRREERARARPGPRLRGRSAPLGAAQAWGYAARART